MLVIPKDSPSIIKTIGIDPGTTRLGISVMHIDLDDLKIKKTYAFTLNGEKLANNFLLSEHYGHRHSRISGMMKEIMGILNYIEPFAISSESPFYNPTRPAAFEALVDVIGALRNTLFQYDQLKPLNLVDPSSVKNSVGARGGANKISMKEAVLALDDLNYDSTVKLEDLDEHAIDSIAVNYWYFKHRILRL